MTFGEAMARILFAYIGVFSTVALVSATAGLLLGLLIRGRQHTRKCMGGREWDVSDALEAWEPVFKEFKPGVARVGEGW